MFESNLKLTLQLISTMKNTWNAINWKKYTKTNKKEGLKQVNHKNSSTLNLKVYYMIEMAKNDPKHSYLICFRKIAFLETVNLSFENKTTSLGKIALKWQAAFNSRSVAWINLFMAAKTSANGRIQTPTSTVRFRHLNGGINHSTTRDLSSGLYQNCLNNKFYFEVRAIDNIAY